MFPANENRNNMSLSKHPVKINTETDELQMPPIFTKVTTGGDRILRKSQFRDNADSFVVGSYEEMPLNIGSPMST